MATMWALTFDRAREDWATSKGLVKEKVEVPTLDHSPGSPDRSMVILQVKYAGFCGSDRGIWHRKSFGEMILSSLEKADHSKRIVGHELLGEIVELGDRVRRKYRYKMGDLVSAESHVVCGTCYQCRLGEHHVCARDKIIGISQDGCFAQYIKIPAKCLWKTDLDRIRPEVAAIQEPFGNAVHACQVTDLRGKTVAVLGTGTIGLFAVLIARGMGARKVIAVEPDAHHGQLAAQLGCDEVLVPGPSAADKPHAADPAIMDRVLELTGGMGVDVAMEMSGFNSSVNNAIQMTRRGGKVILFGVRDGDAVLQNAHRVVMNGLQLHGVIGRQIFGTWDMTRALLEQKDNGIQEAIWKVILRAGQDTIVGIEDWEKESFEKTFSQHPKAIIRFAG